MKKKLHNIDNTGFKTPKDYFETLEDSILSNAKLREIASESSYKVPNGYFDSLEDKIMAVVNQQPETKVIKFISWRKITYIGTVAASIVLIINLFFKNNPEKITIDAIETASIESYILNEDLETNEFASLFSKEELSDIRLINDGYSSQTLENYVFENFEIDDIITK